MGLLIFYVANVANVANVSKCIFCRILRQTFPRKSRTFAPNFKARWNNENNENYANNEYEYKKILNS